MNMTLPLKNQNLNQGQKVIVVDDEELNLDLLEIYLTQAGYMVDCFDSPVEGLKALKEGHSEYCAILLDRMMPEMNGIEFIREYNKVS